MSGVVENYQPAAGIKNKITAGFFIGHLGQLAFGFLESFDSFDPNRVAVGESFEYIQFVFQVCRLPEKLGADRSPKPGSIVNYINIIDLGT